jgi:predicted  nucleic acid-binding Zn-ribbon protein
MMVENVTRRAAKFLLPFAVSAEDREEIFSEDMERAAILCLVESERGKGEGFILKKPAEKLVFVAEMCYPIWLVPWKGRSLLFDGFGVETHTLTYDILPDVKAFINDIQGSAGRREAYSAFLSDALNYFQSFAGQEEKKIEGLITNHEFMRDVAFYLQEAKAIRKPVLDKAFLSPTIDESIISSFIQDFSNLRKTLREDIRNLRKSMKILSVTTREQVKAVREEIREIRHKFDEKIAALKPSILEKAQRIRRKYDDRIARLSQKFDRQLHSLRQERVKLEKTKKDVTAKIDSCESRIESCKLSKDETGELKWRLELEKNKKELSVLEKKIRGADKRIEDAESAKKVEISEIRSEYNVQVEAAMKDLRELESSRDAKIQMSQQEINSLEDTTSTIIDQINKLVGLKRAALNELEWMGVSQRRRKYTLTYLPLYLACYQTELKKRYMLYPPSVAGSLGILTRFKRVFGVSKIKSLLQHRSKPITSLLNQLLTVIEHSPVFEKEIGDAGAKANILRTKESRRRMQKGLEGLKNERWISESEFQTFSELLTKI